MEWNSKWDWENFLGFGSKAIESPKKLQLADWTIVDDGEIDAGSFNLSAGGGNSGASDSDGGHVFSAKSSISASTDSSTKDGMQTPNFSLITFQGFSGNFSKKMEMKGADVSGTSPLLDASIGSVEPLIGLKLGKRTYFENSGAGGNVKTAPLPVMPTTSCTSLKKTKSLGQNLPFPRCVVEGCNVDLSTAKEYHRKHRVCDSHSKCPKVVVGGLERRFCQQCSRFHSLSEFDEKKRSCRRRLSDHNARRRKPQQEAIHFNSTRLSSPFYEGRQQISFLLNNAPVIHSRNPANTTWDSTSNSKFALTKGYPLKSNGAGGTDEQMHMPGIKLPHVIDMHGTATNDFLASKVSIPTVLNPGSKGPLMSSHLDAAPEYHRALSLLSSNSWGSCGPESMPIQHQVHEHGNSVAQPMMHATPEGVPLSSSQFWLTGHQPTQPRVAINGLKRWKIDIDLLQNDVDDYRLPTNTVVSYWYMVNKAVTFLCESERLILFSVQRCLIGYFLPVDIFINKHTLKPHGVIMHLLDCYSGCGVGWIVKPHVAAAVHDEMQVNMSE
ncbi:Squamosa promoter-binding-like protein 12 [Sesamum alatum]|uniref:Squamosa promoter-binding-like protein 12 n=1 Tax=Sesamum alatum TaxID=300844 RepID=A0AAE2C8R0_9LAMI|nr:Squamosa promoter-binding-like protein 12 [Sesamum alatum]